VDIRFYYQNSKSSAAIETLITILSDAVAKVIELPNTLEICFYPFEPNVYGGIDRKHINRIGLNSMLTIDMIPRILTHELIHVHQKHVGVLQIKSNGVCLWHSIPRTSKLPEEMTYAEYQALPWEADVTARLDSVLRQALSSIKLQ
jgi:hypothetical protein